MYACSFYRCGALNLLTFVVTKLSGATDKLSQQCERTNNVLKPKSAATGVG